MVILTEATLRMGQKHTERAGKGTGTDLEQGAETQYMW